ncbi:hypothetical protein PMI33_02019 [Pseudomonas sp. GM67]|nr:hypothetical protein PMI33_02019 [Pseudomonas sp. GM67]
MRESDMKDHDLLEYRRREFTALVEIERDEQNKENGGWVTFDCFSRKQPRGYSPRDTELDLLTLRVSFASVAGLFPSIGESEGRWVKIEVASQISENTISADVVMFGDNAEPVLLHIASVSPIELSNWESAIFMLAGEVRSPASFIAGVLDVSLRESGTLAIAAYDVGQGNCNAIVDEHEFPRVFFDLGWAPNFHARTRPSHQPAFFACNHHTAAPVVLSHWDMDHWCYAIARSKYDPVNLTTKHEWNQEALKRFWIARAPEIEQHQIGPLARSFYDALTRKQLMPGISAMLLWPDNCERIRFADGWLEACEPDTRQTRDRNNTGIAMFVRPKGKGPAILMTGDADFPSIPSLATNHRLKLAGMVAPHHGSTITAAAVPKPMRGSPKKLVLSVGDGNSYGHPKQDSIDAYEAAGWDWTVTLTKDRQECSRTYPPYPPKHEHNHGNILLKFSIKAKDPQCLCGCVRAGNLCLIPSAAPTSAAVAGVKKTRRKKAKTATTP